ncbi:MAG: hypothetical protein K5917_06305 [Clostridiales bacterium]|nr:hypothetical protein [Clostridiales bacterium]
MKNLANVFRDYYYVSPLDFADSAETNRLHIRIVSFVFFLFGFFDLLFVLFLHHDDLRESFVSIVYFGIIAIVNAFAFFFSLKVKDVKREKAYIIKNIPFYLVFASSVGIAIYNFYVLNQPFNGVLTLFLVASIALSVFYVSPLVFSIVLFAGLCPMLPKIYEKFELTGLLDSILVTTIMSCLSFYKRRTEKKYFALLNKQKKNLVAQTFGNFTLLYEGKVVKFSRVKSTELLAYLIYKNGSSVNTKELISALWDGHSDSERYGSSLRSLISDIKASLAKLEIQNFFIAEYNNFRVNPESLQCDYYDFLSGKEWALKTFAGEFMSQYSWAEDAAAFLERKALNRS